MCLVDGHGKPNLDGHLFLLDRVPMLKRDVKKRGLEEKGAWFQRVGCLF